MRSQTKTRLPNTRFRENVSFFCAIFCEITPPQAHDFAKVRFESASSGFPTPMISQTGGTCARFLKKNANCAQRLQKNTCDAFLDLVTICAHVLSSKKPPMTESPGVKARGQTKTRLPNTRFRENARFFARFFAIFCDFS